MHGGCEQVLVCLPPSKDLNGFIQVLRDFPGRCVFVEIPDAYTGMPTRRQWPAQWDWAQVQELPGLLSRGNSAVVGTVLFTAEALRVVGAQTETLFSLR